MKASRWIAGLVMAFLGVSASVAGAARASRPAGEESRAEALFREARQYTVRIRTQIETPLLEDERGAFEGAGFLVDAERGWVLTNAHVAGHCPSSIQVAFAGEPYRNARKIFVDSFADIAVLAVEGTAGRRPAVLDPGTPVVGEPVGAFGHPLGMPFTGTRGIVSGLTDQFGPDQIQIDATVDHGNSGGPVLDLRDGRVIGIATAMVGSQRSGHVNLATPIADARRILDALKHGVTPCPPRLPIALLKDDVGRTTLNVGHSFDAQNWPLEAGDQILAVAGGDPLQTLGDLIGALRGRDRSVAMTVMRGGERRVVMVHPTPKQSALEWRGVSLGGALIGPAEVEDEAVLSEPLALVVHSVEPASVAQSLGIESFDFIESVDGRRFDSVDSLLDYGLHRAPGPMTIVLRRSSTEMRRAYDYQARELPEGIEVRAIGAEPRALTAGPSTPN